MTVLQGYLFGFYSGVFITIAWLAIVSFLGDQE